MILLENDIPIVKNVLSKKLRVHEGGKPESVDSRLSDDDGNIYHIHTHEKTKGEIAFEVSSVLFYDCQSLGLMDRVKKRFKDYPMLTPSPAYHLSFHIDGSKEASNVDKCVDLFGSIRYVIYEELMGIFFDAMKSGTEKSVLLNIRSNEKISIAAKGDRITVSYVLDFSSDEDIIIGKIFMNEFKEGKKGAANAPQVIVTYKEPPTELAGLKVPSGINVGYVTFVFNKNHVSDKTKGKTVANIMNFLQYFKYHMKCSKAHLNSRMRSKTEDFVKLINRARPEVKSTEKKTFSGKTFAKD